MTTEIRVNGNFVAKGRRGWTRGRFMRWLLLLAGFVLPLAGVAQTASPFTQQPMATTGSVGGTADFSFTIRVQGFGANLGVYAFKGGVNVGSRFTLISQSISNQVTSGGSFTQGAFTARISNLTLADAGNYTFEVTVNGVRYSNTTTQPAALTVSAAPMTPPVITTQPQNTTVAAFDELRLTVQASGTGLSYQWFKNSSPLSATGTSYAVALATVAETGVYHVVVSNGGGSATSNKVVVLVQNAGGPVITTQPASADVASGQRATFAVGLQASVFSASYQWLYNGERILGATNSTYTVEAASTAAAGGYAVIVSNSFGSVMSSTASLRIVAASAPTITTQPAAVTQRAGQAVSLSVTASGTPTPTYQWHKNGVPIPGATATTLSIASAQPSDAGAYTVLVSNAAGSVWSAAAHVTVTPPIIDPARLINLSVRSEMQAGETMTLGVVVGGAGTAGTKPLLVRAAGPALAAFGVANAMTDPRIDLYSGSVLSAANDNWGGAIDLRTAFGAVGAFAFEGTSRDAAIYNPALAAGSYTMQLRGVGVSEGVLLAELYDATATGTFTAATPRLINVSVLKDLQSGPLIAGFVVGGAGTRNVLIRAIGPTLGQPPFNVGGAMADPKLELYSAQTLVATNDNWGSQQNGTSAAGIAAAAEAVGAFRIADVGSRDAVLLVTLNPGSYTAQVAAAAGATGGNVLVEVYEVP